MEMLNINNLEESFNLLNKNEEDICNEINSILENKSLIKNDLDYILSKNEIDLKLLEEHK
jgi:preprotein translocase subunit SecA